MLTLHHLENSRSQRVLWLLEELGLEYELKRYERDKKTNLAPLSLKKAHPLGKSPVLEDDGRVIAETGAMIEYILDHYGEGRLLPSLNSPDYDRYRYWIHAAEGSYMPPLVIQLLLNRMETAPMPFFVRPVAKKLVAGVRDGYLSSTTSALYDYLHDELGRGAWLAGGEMTGADIMMSFPLEAFSVRGDVKSYPRFKEFLDRIHARPAYKRALERGGPYALLR